MNKYTISKLTILVIFFVSLISITACSSFRVSPQDYDNIKVERLPDKRVNIYQPKVYREGDQVVVSGTMKGTRFRSRLNGHVDIAVIGPEEKIMALQSVKCYRKPFNRRSSKYGYSSTITIPISTEDIIIRIAYHKPVVSNHAYCGNNLAVHDLSYN